MELQTTSFLWLFQLDDSKSLHKNWLFRVPARYPEISWVKWNHSPKNNLGFWYFIPNFKIPNKKQPGKSACFSMAKKSSQDFLALRGARRRRFFFSERNKKHGGGFSKVDNPGWLGGPWFVDGCNPNLYIYIYTLPETNVAPEKGCLEDYFPIGKAYFQRLC